MTIDVIRAAGDAVERRCLFADPINGRCTNDRPPPGRGRPPEFCPDHKTPTQRKRALRDAEQHVAEQSLAAQLAVLREYCITGDITSTLAVLAEALRALAEPAAWEQHTAVIERQADDRARKAELHQAQAETSLAELTVDLDAARRELVAMRERVDKERKARSRARDANVEALGERDRAVAAERRAREALASAQQEIAGLTAQRDAARAATDELRARDQRWAERFGSLLANSSARNGGGAE